MQLIDICVCVCVCINRGTQSECASTYCVGLQQLGEPMLLFWGFCEPESSEGSRFVFDFGLGAFIHLHTQS